MNQLNRKCAIAACVATLAAAGVAAPTASAEVTYSPLYWQLLDKYASVEANWAPIRGVYGTDPECALAQQRGESIGCGGLIAIMNPDGTFGGGWVDDPSAPDGWREMTVSDCPAVDSFEDPYWWLCYG
jgi:hypothetical protein